MDLAMMALGAAALLTTAYFTYGRILTWLLRLDARTPTPAYELRDDNDFVPTEPKFLLSQHFSAIAAAGPIVGPITAGLLFGWLPALVWILVGSILIGGVHDLAALTASIRHKARSIAEVVREHMSARSYALFLAFIWIALVYIIVAFTDVTASSFVGKQTLDTGDSVAGAAIASSSLMYLVLPIIMGLLMRYAGLSLNWATAIFVPLIGLSVYAGQYVPVNLEALFPDSYTAAEKITAAHKTWDILLLAYCLVAGVLPMWMLLQPRGHLGGYFLYIALAAGGIGLLFSGKSVEYPAFIGLKSQDGKSLFPYLFITIACGACSGFHALIASGTTSKQLRHETDARPIAYGSMLLEAMVAIISLSCVMILRPDSSTAKGTPNLIYANGLGSYVEMFGVAKTLAMSFALMAFSTFVFDTLDVCTRLGRYIIQELIGMHDRIGALIGTGLTAGVPVLFIMQKLEKNGKPVPIWRVFWDLFGASNQLLAALTLLGVTVWLWRTRRESWVWFVTGIPCVWMYAMSSWALTDITIGAFRPDGVWTISRDPVAWAGLFLLSMAALMLIEAISILLRDRGRSNPTPRPALAAG